ncbi:hypothetical protein, variant [Blastomyces dermatitidis ER-3]|uniref:Uncharacterized protein n=1 Tax=Ajellomyces dermatitidis (strain ER-3 / ATCC MYA-2586) TaxID=559297 RepID=A0ABX2VUS2_AJEDR|nr:uncharacterized protein BDCG_03815 [Blastomyces dermatitidis ER-3]XP_045280627.1 hypothetical protein, variant [Blastomyces dermatitidis ER-3]EEQ88695.1 hypothetical protein BDCG_03815 [Blastomyces dermatitidis ER-3]OAT00900.1 hypothetical protein, variant [Blastomyces dermatitidis ER-3]
MEMYTKGFTGYQPNNRLDIYIVPYQGRKNTERDEGERKKRGKKKGRAKMKKSEEVEEETTRRRLMDANHVLPLLAQTSLLSARRKQMCEFVIAEVEQQHPALVKTSSCGPSLVCFVVQDMMRRPLQRDHTQARRFQGYMLGNIATIIIAIVSYPEPIIPTAGHCRGFMQPLISCFLLSRAANGLQAPGYVGT